MRLSRLSRPRSGRRSAAVPEPVSLTPLALAALLVLALAGASSAAPPAATRQDEAPDSTPAAAAADTAPEDPAAAGREHLAEVHDYLSRDGGRWRAKNAAHGPGAATPAQFGYEFDWVLDRSAVAARIFAVQEDGSEQTLWRALTTYHPGEREVVVYSVSRDGDVSRGTYEVIDESHHRLHLTVTSPGGESFQIRDDMEILTPDRFLSSTSLLRDGEWVKLEGQDWRRVRNGAS